MGHPVGQLLNRKRNISTCDDTFHVALLKEYQCQAQANLVLQRGRKIIITAFQFSSIDGAYGTYCAEHHGSSSYTVVGDASSEDQDSISFCKDQYYACLQCLEQDDEEAKALINSLAKKIVEHIELVKIAKEYKAIGAKLDNGQLVITSSKPKIFNWLPTMERVRGSEKIIAGLISMRRFFPAPYNSYLCRCWKRLFLITN